MRIWNITTRSKSIYRVTEDNGVWKFGAEEEVHEPTAWPPVVGERMTLYFAGHSPAADRYSVISTSPVESVTEVTPEPEAAHG